MSFSRGCSEFQAFRGYCSQDERPHLPRRANGLEQEGNWRRGRDSNPKLQAAPSVSTTYCQLLNTRKLANFQAVRRIQPAQWHSMDSSRLWTPRGAELAGSMDTMRSVTDRKNPKRGHGRCRDRIVSSGSAAAKVFLPGREIVDPSPVSLGESLRVSHSEALTEP